MRKATTSKKQKAASSLTKDAKRTNSLIIGVVTVIALIGFGGGLVLSSRNNDSARGPVQTQCDGTCVALYSGRSDPEVITITSGSFVQFNVADGKKHSLSIGEDSGHHTEKEQFSSGDFEGKEAWRVQFKKDGAYQFSDKYFPETKINVVVYTEGKDYKISP